MRMMINTYIAVSLLIKTLSIIALAMIIIGCGAAEENRRSETECKSSIKYVGSYSSYGYLHIHYKNLDHNCRELIWENSGDLSVRITDETYNEYKDVYILGIGREEYYTGQTIQTPIPYGSISITLIEADDDFNRSAS